MKQDSSAKATWLSFYKRNLNMLPVDTDAADENQSGTTTLALEMTSVSGLKLDENDPIKRNLLDMHANKKIGLFLRASANFYNF